MFFRRNYAYWIPRKYRKMYDEAIRLDAQKEMRDEARAQGRAEGRALKMYELVQKKMQKGYTVSEIADVLEEKEENIERIIKELTGK